MLDNVHSLKASDLLFEGDVNEKDMYVVDKEFNWTYVITHECGLCGPYFARKDK